MNTIYPPTFCSVLSIGAGSTTLLDTMQPSHRNYSSSSQNVTNKPVSILIHDVWRKWLPEFEGNVVCVTTFCHLWKHPSKEVLGYFMLDDGEAFFDEILPNIHSDYKK